MSCTVTWMGTQHAQRSVKRNSSREDYVQKQQKNIESTKARSQ